MLASSSASANDSATDTINLTIPESCTLSTSSGSGQTYNAQISNGQYKNDIGKTRLSVFCNTQDSFAVYAVGYSNDTVGSTDMVNTTSGATNILTGTATSGSDSSWAMKIEAVAGNGTDIYTPTVLNPYDDFTSVPSSYAKVAEVTSATTRTVEGAIDATYQVYISPRQQAGAYTGKVRYTVVHPASVDPSAGQANLDTGSNINKKLKSLASGTDVTNTGTVDNLITAFVRSDTLPANFAPSTANTISRSNSLTPVYIWFDSNDGTMYYYSKANEIWMDTSSPYLFNRMKSLTNISGLKHFIAANVASMGNLFSESQISDLSPLSNWDVGNVSFMFGIFSSTPISDLQPIANWDVGNVRDAGHMFQSTQISDLTPIANWNTSNLAFMTRMFVNTRLINLDPIANWNTKNVVSVYEMFYNIPTLSNANILQSWNLDKVTTTGRCQLGLTTFTSADETCFFGMFSGTTPKTNLPIFTSRPGTWNSFGTYIPNP